MIDDLFSVSRANMWLYIMGGVFHNWRFLGLEFSVTTIIYFMSSNEDHFNDIYIMFKFYN